MNTKQLLIIGSIVLALGVAFGVGRWSAPEKIKIQTVEVEKKVEDKKTDVSDHKVTTVTETDKPDGTKEKKTIITDDRDTKVDDKTVDTSTKTETKEVEKSSSKLTISLLGAVDVTNPGIPTYGVSITRPILGPITVGAFGFQNGLVGMSIGLTF